MGKEVNLYTSTVKYIAFAIREFTPALVKLVNSSSGQAKNESRDLLEMLEDIATQIDSYGLVISNPNRMYEGEPHEIELRINDEVLEDLVRLVSRLLVKWKQEASDIKRKKYLTVKNQRRLDELEYLFEPLEILMVAQGSVFLKYSSKGPLIFPGENNQEERIVTTVTNDNTTLFPIDLVNLLPNDVKVICEEFNFNKKNNKHISCILLLRRLLPLAIVRKFQQINKEGEIKRDGEYLETRALLGKAKLLFSTKKIYDVIIDYKLLIDSSQHIFTFTISPQDIPGPAIAIRVMLGDLFRQEKDS